MSNRKYPPVASSLLFATISMTVIWIGVQRMLTSVSLWGDGDIRQAILGLLLVFTGCALFLHFNLNVYGLRLGLFALVTAPIGFGLAYWILLPIVDALLRPLPRLANSGALATGIVFASICFSANHLSHWICRKRWLIDLLYLISAIGILTLLEFLLTQNSMAALPFITNESMRTFVYGLVTCWLAVILYTNLMAVTE